MEQKYADRLVILWTSGDRDIAKKMVFLYAKNSLLKEWWKEVQVIVWGPSAKLLTVDLELQDDLKECIDAGVHFVACQRCAESYDVVNELEAMGVNVFFAGKLLTEYLKEGKNVLTV